jgi:diguanylate cyclase (GGDEF)-like protein
LTAIELYELWIDQFFLAQTSDPYDEVALEQLLAEAKQRQDHPLVASLLRGRTYLRRLADRHYNAELNCAELDRYGQQHGIAAAQASAWALRAAWWLDRDELDVAVDALARAVPILDDELPADYGLSAALGDCLTVYQRLALYELALPLWERITAVVAALGHADEIMVTLFNQVIFHLGWALHLERVGAACEAAARFGAATEFGGKFRTGNGSGVFGPFIPLVEMTCQIFSGDAAVDVDQYRKLLSECHGLDPDETAIFRIASARLLRQHGQLAEAVAAVDYDDAALASVSRSSVAAALTWEAVLCERARGNHCARSERHAKRAEQELWAQRQLRLRHATERIAHERLRRERDEAARLAREDTLTGLPNRRHLDDAVPAAVSDARRAGRPLSLAIIDLDGFKAVNDEFSHRFGDQVLRDVAATLQAVVRSGDLIGRFGGDEFVALFTDTDTASAEAVMWRAAAAVDELRWTAPDRRQVGITLSIGVAALPEGVDVDGLYTLADRAMYAAKRAGGNGVRALTVS